MLKQIFSKFFRQPLQTAEIQVRAATVAVPIRSARALQYPPQDPGFSCTEAVELVEAQSDIIAMLKIHAASAPAHFKVRYEQPIINLAEYIANLPGTASGVFAGEGGLFRAGVEMAFNSFRASDGRIFTGSSGVEERHLLEGRWRYVCFAAGLLYPVGASIQSMQVLNSEGQRWSAELDPLQSWLGAGQPFWVTWNKDDVEPGPDSIMGMILHQILGRPNIDWLNAGSPDLIKRLVEIVTGSPAASSYIATSVVKNVWSSVHEREVARRHQNYGRLVVGSHISPYIIDAMVILAKQKWRINQSIMFVDTSSVHLEWPAAGIDIIEYCKSRGYQGIPSSETALLTMLTANKIIVGGLDGVALCEIANSSGEIVGAIKLAKPGLLIDDFSAYAKTARPVAIEDIVAADPLTTPSPEVKVRKPAAKKEKVEQSPVVDRPTLDTLQISDPVPVSEVTPEASKPAETQSPQIIASESVPVEESVDSKACIPTELQASKIPAEVKSGQQQLPLTEGAEIKYASLVEKDVALKLKPTSTEILGKLIHAWREKTDPKYVMRITPVGAAVEQEFLLMCSSRGLDAILEWATVGLLYIDPMRPGVKLHQIATVDGGQKKVNCVIFSRSAAKILGLN